MADGLLVAVAAPVLLAPVVDVSPAPSSPTAVIGDGVPALVFVDALAVTGADTVPVALIVGSVTDVSVDDSACVPEVVTSGSAVVTACAITLAGYVVEPVVETFAVSFCRPVPVRPEAVLVVVSPSNVAAILSSAVTELVSVDSVPPPTMCGIEMRGEPIPAAIVESTVVIVFPTAVFVPVVDPCALTVSTASVMEAGVETLVDDPVVERNAVTSSFGVETRLSADVVCVCEPIGSSVRPSLSDPSSVPNPSRCSLFEPKYAVTGSAFRSVVDAVSVLAAD